MKRGCFISLYVASFVLFLYALFSPITINIPVESPKVASASTTKVVDETPQESSSLINEINSVRAAVGLNPLLVDKSLESAAITRVKDMIDTQYYSHISPDTGNDYSALLTYDYAYSCENLNLTFSDNYTDIVSSWMASTSHRGCLLSERVGVIGYSAGLFTSYVGDYEESYISAVILASTD